MAAHRIPITFHGHTRGRISVRVRAWRARDRLDAELAAGAAWSERPELAHRADVRTRPAQLRRLAEAIESVVDAAHDPAMLITAVAPLQRDETVRAQGQRLALARALRQTGHTGPRGPAITSWLLTDCNSPLYSPQTAGDLSAMAQGACDALRE